MDNSGIGGVMGLLGDIRDFSRNSKLQGWQKTPEGQQAMQRFVSTGDMSGIPAQHMAAFQDMGQRLAGIHQVFSQSGLLDAQAKERLATAGAVGDEAKRENTSFTNTGSITPNARMAQAQQTIADTGRLLQPSQSTLNLGQAGQAENTGKLFGQQAEHMAFENRARGGMYGNNPAEWQRQQVENEQNRLGSERVQAIGGGQGLMMAHYMGVPTAGLFGTPPSETGPVSANANALELRKFQEEVLGQKKPGSASHPAGTPNSYIPNIENAPLGGEQAYMQQGLDRALQAMHERGISPIAPGNTNQFNIPLTTGAVRSISAPGSLTGTYPEQYQRRLTVGEHRAGQQDASNQWFQAQQAYNQLNPGGTNANMGTNLFDYFNRMFPQGGQQAHINPYAIDGQHLPMEWQNAALMQPAASNSQEGLWRFLILMDHLQRQARKALTTPMIKEDK